MIEDIIMRECESSARYDAAKRVFDVAASLALLVIAAPVILLCGLLVKLSSRGPLFYFQVRLGKGGQPFRMVKVRTMAVDAERDSGACWAQAHDPRATRVGRLLRRTHLDELPQLWNVLKGEMSLVGPRPERPEFVPRLAAALPGYRERMQVRPGITGLAQVRLPADSDLESVRRKLSFDLFYVRCLGPMLDVRILMCTACYLFAIPFELSCRLFRVPGRRTVATRRGAALAHAA